jgi:spermidine synthase
MRLADTRLLFHLILTDRVAEMFADGVIHSDNRPYLEFAAPRHLYTSNRGFATELKQRPRISPATASIIASSRDLDMVLNMAELSTSLFAPAFPAIDLSDATPEQTARYQELVREFCTKRVVEDYMTFYDNHARKICADVQAGLIARHLDDTPNDGNAWGDLGVIYARRAEFDKAGKALGRYIAEKPEEPNAYFRMGVLLVMKKSYSRAREQFLKTVSLNPGHSAALLYLAKLNLLEGEKAAAVKRLQQVLAVDENPEAEALLRQVEQNG